MKDLGAASKVESILTPPDYKIELVYIPKRGPNSIEFLKQLSLGDGCPGKSYEERLEIDEVPLSITTQWLNRLNIRKDSNGSWHFCKSM